jgi:thiamine transporter ThiT
MIAALILSFLQGAVAGAVIGAVLTIYGLVRFSGGKYVEYVIVHVDRYDVEHSRHAIASLSDASKN